MSVTATCHIDERSKQNAKIQNNFEAVPFRVRLKFLCQLVDKLKKVVNHIYQIKV